MKSLAAALGVYILILSLLPCADNCGAALPFADNHDHHHIEGEHHHHDHDEPQNHTDDCSPFCFCACCGIHIITTDIPTIPGNNPKPIPSARISLPSHSAEATFFNKAWKPPKLT